MENKKYISWLIEFLCITAIAIILSQANWSEYWILVPFTSILGLKVYEYKVAIKEKHLRVRAQLDLLIKLVPFEDVLGVRCTYHVPVWRKQFLQTCDYIPCGGGGGRKFSKMKGIVGRSMELKEKLIENFENDEEFRTKMTEKYGYTPEEVGERTADRRSYFCYPILDENHRVLGLIYFDSSHPNIFTLDSTDSKMQIIEKACETIRNDLL
jgi:hypothetical protein